MAEQARLRGRPPSAGRLRRGLEQWSARAGPTEARHRPSGAFGPIVRQTSQPEAGFAAGRPRARDPCEAQEEGDRRDHGLPHVSRRAPASPCVHPRMLAPPPTKRRRLIVMARFSMISLPSTTAGASLRRPARWESAWSPTQVSNREPRGAGRGGPAAAPPGRMAQPAVGTVTSIHTLRWSDVGKPPTSPQSAKLNSPVRRDSGSERTGQKTPASTSWRVFRGST